MSSPRGRDKASHRRSMIRILVVVAVLTSASSLIFAAAIGVDTPEKQTAVLLLVLSFLLLSLPSAYFAEHTIAVRKEQALAGFPFRPGDRESKGSFIGYSASGRGWKMSASTLLLSFVVLAFAVGPFADVAYRIGLPSLMRWIFASLWVICLAAAFALLKKHTIIVDGVGVRCEGRFLRDFSVLWVQVGRIDCFDVSLLFSLIRSESAMRSYVFRSAEGHSLGWVNPSMELGKRDAAKIERAIVDQAMAHKIEIASP